MSPAQHLVYLPQDWIGWGAGDNKKSLLRSSTNPQDHSELTENIKNKLKIDKILENYESIFKTIGIKKKETQLFGKHTHIYSNAFALRPRQEQCVKQTDRLEIAKVNIKVTDGI